MLTLVLIFTGLVLLSYSINLYDGIFYFCIIWLLSIWLTLAGNQNFLAYEISIESWGLFSIGLFISRLLNIKILLPSGINKNPIKIFKPKMLNKIVLFCVASNILSILGTLLVNASKYTGSGSWALSKNVGLYTLTGLFGTFIFTLIKYIAFYSNHISSKNKLKISLFFIFGFIENISNAFRTSLVFYSTKIIEDIPGFLTVYILPYCNNESLKKIITKFLIQKRLFLYLIYLLGIGVICTLFLSIFNINLNALIELVLFKIQTRADVYPLISDSILDKLFAEYSYKIQYFFHPFLKMVGQKAYTLPMGGFVLAGPDPTFIGGPNFHLPLALYVIGGKNALFRSSFILAFGIFLGLVFNTARVNYKNINYIGLPSWGTFIQYTIPLLLMEPSVWCHMFFFMTLITLITKYFLKYIFK